MRLHHRLENQGDPNTFLSSRADGYLEAEQMRCGEADTAG